MDKEQQKKLLIEIMEADEKDGLYDHIGDTNKMVTMKLYTEEQVRDAIELAREKYPAEFIPSINGIMLQFTPIELPSDEEMDKFLLDNSYEYGYGYRDAIDWVKKQIINQNK